MSPVERWERVFIGGRWTQPTGDLIEVVNPHTAEVHGTVRGGSTVEVEAAVLAARRAFDTGPWARMPYLERQAALVRLLSLYERFAPALTDLIVAEMGSPISWASRTQVVHPVEILRYYAQLEVRPGELSGDSTGARYKEQLPVGVVAAITPWNMPQKTIMMKLAPALLAGCTVIVKPAPQTPIDALHLAQIVEMAKLPPGVVNVLPCGNAEAEMLATHRGVDKVAFTGSTAVGARLAQLCGADLRRISTELGGKSATIVCDDADLDLFVQSLPELSLANNGQICSNHTRILAPQNRYSEVVEAVTELAGSLQIGDPADPETEIGPLVTYVQFRNVQRALRQAEAEGAVCTIGSGTILGQRGWYMHPVVFAEVDNGMDIARKEVFGPVLTVLAYQDEDQAVAIANDSPYGLDGGVWTTDPVRGLALARQLRVGNVSVNGTPIGINTPLGGFKQSGIGRELGREGLASFQETRVVAFPDRNLMEVDTNGSVWFDTTPEVQR